MAEVRMNLIFIFRGRFMLNVKFSEIKTSDNVS